MPVHSIYLSRLDSKARARLLSELHERQNNRCFLCDESIDLDLHSDNLHVDHVVPIANQGADNPANFALTHSVCNEKKGSSNLEIARLLMRFERIEKEARAKNGRGANLQHILDRVDNFDCNLKLRVENDEVLYSFQELNDPLIRRTPLYKDHLSGMKYFFGLFPVEYLHHDDRINPRTIGGGLRGLMEEFYAKRPQLQVSLAWWAPVADGAGPVKVFDGQHKAAAQILLGAKMIPLRIFVQPDLKVLLNANTNAGDTLKQVAFDQAVKRHLGSSLYRERLAEFRQARKLLESDMSFSEQDLVAFFKGARKEMLRYILDSVRNSVTQDPENLLMEFVEMAGKGGDRPLSYSAVERTFFSLFLYPKALDTWLDHMDDQGRNPRHLEHIQVVRLMSLYADVLLVGSWNREHASTKLEHKVRQGEPVPDSHLRAHRMSREEVLHATLTYVALIIKNFYAYTGQLLDEEKLMQSAHPDALWDRIRNFLTNLSTSPCWVNRHLSETVFGAKQSRDFWLKIFDSGRTPSGVSVIQPIEIQSMIVAQK